MISALRGERAVRLLLLFVALLLLAVPAFAGAGANPAPQTVTVIGGQPFAGYLQDIPSGMRPSEPVVISHRSNGGDFFDWEEGIVHLSTANRRIALHEIGHFYDKTNLDWPTRDRLMEIMGVEVWADGGNHTGAERFAETYKGCALSSRKAIGSLWWKPTRAQFRAVCRMIG